MDKIFICLAFWFLVVSDVQTFSGRSILYICLALIDIGLLLVLDVSDVRTFSGRSVLYSNSLPNCRAWLLNKKIQTLFWCVKLPANRQAWPPWFLQLYTHRKHGRTWIFSADFIYLQETMMQIILLRLESFVQELCQSFFSQKAITKIMALNAICLK